MLFRSALTIFLLGIPSVLANRKLLKSGANRRRQLKTDKESTSAPTDGCDGDPDECLFPPILRRTFVLQAEESSFSFGTSEAPLPPGWTWNGDGWAWNEVTDSLVLTSKSSFTKKDLRGDGFEPAIVGSLFVNRGYVVSIDGADVEGPDENYHYTLLCTVLEGEIQTDMTPGLFVAKASCDIDVCAGRDEGWNPSCFYLRFSGITDQFFPFRFPGSPSFNFRASMISGEGEYRGSIGEALVNQSEDEILIDLAVIQFGFPDFFTTW